MKPVDLFILGIVFGALFVYYLIRLFKNYKLRHQSKKAKRAERLAMKILSEHGYTVLAEQKRVPIVTKIDGRKYKNHVAADFIVKKNGLKYVVDVKTGKQTERPTAADIRRQLLEYYLIYHVDGVLLVDMENKTIRNVEFELKLPLHYSANYFICVFAFICGVLVTLLIVKGGKIF